MSIIGGLFKVKRSSKNNFPSNPKKNAYGTYNSLWNKNCSEKFKSGLNNCADDLEQIMNLLYHDAQQIGTSFLKMIYKYRN